MIQGNLYIEDFVNLTKKQSTKAYQYNNVIILYANNIMLANTFSIKDDMRIYYIYLDQCVKNHINLISI